MVCCCDNRDQNPHRICDAKEDIEQLPESGFAQLAWLEGLAEDSRVVDQGAADAEGVSEVHGWHCCQSVHIVSLHPYTLGVVASHAVQKSVLAR